MFLCSVSLLKHYQSKNFRTKPEVMIILPNQILSLPTEVANIDLKYVTIDELQTLSSRKFVSITRTGAFHGLAIWFNVSFNSYEDEWINSTLNTGKYLVDKYYTSIDSTLTCFLLPK